MKRASVLCWTHAINSFSAGEDVPAGNVETPPSRRNERDAQFITFGAPGMPWLPNEMSVF